MGPEGIRLNRGRAAVGALAAVLALAALTVGPTLLAGGEDEAKAGGPNVTVTVTGLGTVYEPPPGTGTTVIQCRAGNMGTCSHNYVTSNVAFAAVPDAGQVHTDWGGVCDGEPAGTECSRTLSTASHSVTATFSGAPPTPTPTPAAAPSPTPTAIGIPLRVRIRRCKKKFDGEKQKKCIKRVKNLLG